MMDETRLSRAEEFLYKNARLLERRRFEFHFRQGSREAVLGSLEAYRNQDGGFGNGLEPDKRVPDSQPIDQEFALHILHQTGAGLEAVGGVCDFLASVTTEEGGVPFSLPNANAYPHAFWWASEPDPPARINPTASLVGLLYALHYEHPWRQHAETYAWQNIKATETTEAHDLLAILVFLEHHPDQERATRAFERVAPRILSQCALDPSAEGYVKKPLDWAPTPQSLCRPLFSDDVLNAHLDAMEADQQPDGGWKIAWEPISAGVACEWRGALTLGNLLLLRAWGRL
jgi:hypothetical protein